MKSTFLLLTLTFSLSTCFAQNLVPNPSFEDTTGIGCPSSPVQSILPMGWSSYNLTPDYFNTCSPSIYFNSVPINGWGNQNAASGNAYCGAWVYQTSQQNTREYIGGQLLTPTVIGQKYYANLKVSLAEISNCGSNRIGILLSTIPFVNNNMVHAHITNFAHIYSTVIVTDTLNWTNISGSFIADSSYKYIIIGNFFDDINTDTTITGVPKAFGYGSYFFIDDIYLGKDSTEGIEYSNVQDLINVYPNPASDLINIQCRSSGINKIKIYNTIGVLCIEKNITGENTVIDIHSLSSGLYFIQFFQNNIQLIINFKIIKS